MPAIVLRSEIDVFQFAMMYMPNVAAVDVNGIVAHGRDCFAVMMLRDS